MILDVLLSLEYYSYRCLEGHGDGDLGRGGIEDFSNSVTFLSTQIQTHYKSTLFEELSKKTEGKDIFFVLFISILGSVWGGGGGGGVMNKVPIVWKVKVLPPPPAIAKGLQKDSLTGEACAGSYTISL